MKKKSLYLKNVNTITGKEKLFIEFEMGKSKTESTETIFLKNSDIKIKKLLSDSENKVLLFEKKYHVQDDHNEKGSINKVGTTIVNLLNASDDVLLTLKQFLSALENFNFEEVKQICLKISGIIDKYNLRTYNVKNITDTIYMLYNAIIDASIYKKYKENISIHEKYKGNISNLEKELYYLIKDDVKDKEDYDRLILCDEFLEEIYSLKNNYMGKLDLIMLVDVMLHNEVDLEKDFFHQILLNIVEKLEKNLRKTFNIPLRRLLQQIFKQFYNDFKTVDDDTSLNKLLKNNEEKLEQKPYNNYYKELDTYLSILENNSINEIKKIKSSHITNNHLPKKFEQFTYKDMAIVFVTSLINDIEFMQNNYQEPNTELKYYTAIKSKENTYIYEISSWRELFYVSKFHIQKNKTYLKRCATCGQIFIAEKPNRDNNCQRKCASNPKYTCREYALVCFRNGNKNTSKISKISNNIGAYMRKIHKEGKINSETFLKETTNCKNIRNSNELTEEEKIEKLNKLHEELKNRYGKGKNKNPLSKNKDSDIK